MRKNEPKEDENMNAQSRRNAIMEVLKAEEKPVSM